MPPKPVKRDSSASLGRSTPPAIPAFKPHNTSRPSSPTPVDVSPETPNKAAETVKNVYKTYMTSLSSAARAQALYTVFADLTDELADIAHFPELIQRIVNNLHDMGFTPSALATPSALPCTLNHDPITVTVTKEVIKEVIIPAQPCALSHDPVTITVTKEVHPSSCATEMKKLRKELSDLTTGINALYHSTRITHTANTPVCPPPSIPDSPSTDHDSIYDNTDTASSVFSTPTAGPKPLPKSLPPMSTPVPFKSFASAAKTNVVSNKSPKEIIRDRAAKSCTNKGTPSNVLVLSDFKSANTAESYKRIAEMRKNINDTLLDNKCKSISYDGRYRTKRVWPYTNVKKS
ncbi:hypothetical protein JOM56_012633 [Amanita muscaria]